MGTPEGVRALDEETGSVVWQSDRRGFPLSVREGTVYVRRLTDDLQSLCFDALEAATGRFLRTVVIGAYGGRIVGLSRVDGRRLWVHECGSETSRSVFHEGHYSTLTFSGDLVTPRAR